MSKLLENLKERVNGWAEEAVRRPALSLEIEKIKRKPIYGRQYFDNEILRNVGRASIQFEATEILGLDIGEFVSLQGFLRSQVLDGATKIHPEMSLVALKWQTKSYSSYNTLAHERQHLQAAESRGEAIAMSLTVHKHLFTGLDGQSYFGLGLTGQALVEGCTQKDLALISIAPEALSAGDIDNARLYADESGDQSFRQMIEDRISKKKTMDRIYL